MKRTIALLLILLLALALCSCGSSSDSDAPAAEAVETEAAVVEDFTGKYTTFGATTDQYSDYIVEAGDMFNSSITLNDGGAGEMSYDDESFELDSWSVENGVLTLTESGSSLSGTIKDGIIILYFEEAGTTAYYAREGADTSAYPTITLDEFAGIIAAEEAEEE